MTFEQKKSAIKSFIKYNSKEFVKMDHLSLYTKVCLLEQIPHYKNFTIYCRKIQKRQVVVNVQREWFNVS
jgi:hypothetical protein